MPLYEYQCQDCKNRFERIEKASAMHDGVCPECGGVAHRLLGAPALKFKGSGWYVTDYGKGNGERPTHPEKGTESATDSSSTEAPAASEKSDTKAAPTSSSKVA
ncbi:MAG: FmdB family zinc ribbon protein [Thermoanaerobaculales bacterium]|jgi:putative FmdB family regulatory protein|nr:FmdB family zinc ribbon protein [Thermoanaerobaculales bacterium]